MRIYYPRDLASPRQKDVDVKRHGSLTLLVPVTYEAQEWIDENVADDAQFYAGALVVEPRALGDILDGMREAGLRV